MKNLYILDPTTFNGTVLNTMTAPTLDKNHPNYKDLLNCTYVHYEDGLTFKEYNQKHDNKLIALSWDDFSEQYYTPYLKSLQGDFLEITEERYFDMLECVPPKKWHDLNDSINVFFVGECYTHDLHTCCIKDRKTKKYYSTLRSINTKDDVLLTDFLTTKKDNEKTTLKDEILKTIDFFVETDKKIFGEVRPGTQEIVEMYKPKNAKQ